MLSAAASPAPLVMLENPGSLLRSTSRGTLTSRGSAGTAAALASSPCSPVACYADGRTACTVTRRPLSYPRLLRLSIPLLGGMRRSPTPREGKPSEKRTSTTAVNAAAAGMPAEDGGRREGAATGGGILGAIKAAEPLRRFMSIFNVFSDERCNSKLLALAVGQMLCSIATLIHDSYLPIYVHEELGLSTTKIGAVQGAAQFLCQISKGVSGVVGDILGSQTRVLVFGTLLTFVCKPMFAMLSSVYGVFGVTTCLYWFFAAKLFDRLSKGIREAPTKAVMNELAKESGDAPDAAYGLRQSLATAGMLIGSTVASLTFAATGHNYILTFAAASVPPLLALVWLTANFRDEIFGVRAPAAAVAVPAAKPVAADAAAKPAAAAAPPPAAASATAAADGPKLSPLQKAVAILTAFKPAYWQALAVVAVLYFARFDASFLSLRAKSVMPKTLLPMMTLVNTLIQMTLTAPLARISGASVQNRNRLLLAGFAFMVLANATFMLPATANSAGMFLGSGLIGLHMAMTHAITISMVSSYMPTGVLPGVGKLSGTAVSFTDLLLGFVLAASNALAGVLTDMSRANGLGNIGCFAGGATACVASGLLLILFERFGDLGRNDLVASRKKAPPPPPPAAPAAPPAPADGTCTPVADATVKAKPE